ncbi:YdeI/OmpD-associated family protein [Cognatilysobacter segetis]|uniref:YdeI/OmpD-associated family protein n=1 Tax=Cognatilysobacter segetis TaxID=2492394 RepID=UPI00105DE5ED|nr:YdeI/OmpD-associated family protein [Lysobacter segetis]
MAGNAIRFDATLLRPASPKNAAWSFVVLPAAASAKLPTRAMTPVDGTLAGHAFRATLEPDGQGSHWLKVSRALREAAGARVGDVVRLVLVPAAVTPEPRVPPDLRKALADAPQARAQWSTLTPAARRDWIQWLESAKQASTRERRVASSCDMLAAGKRRVCCFDRSGIYSKAIAAPDAAEPTPRPARKRAR